MPLRREGKVIVAVVALAIVTGVVLLVLAGGPEVELARRYARAWERGQYGRMYAELSAGTRRRYRLAVFAEAHRQALATATATAVDTGRPRHDGDFVVVPLTVRTRIFRVVKGDVRLPLDGAGDAARIGWIPRLAFPDLRRGEVLSRHTRLPARAALLARDGTPLAEGPERKSPVASVAADVAGRLGPIPPAERRVFRAAGYPDDARIGLTGLERVFETRLAGRPGGTLLAGRRALATARARPAPAVRTSISVDVERAAVAALGGRLGGVVALRPRTGEVLAFAGIAFSGLQPPGSTFKVLTLTGALEHRVVDPGDVFPYETSTTLSGVRLGNAHGESCGGTLAQAFAHSCNSVFAPLGARLGARRLVDIAQRFGFNRPPGIPGAAISAIPPAGELGDDIGVGSSAIGQGRVLATTLQMALVAATIGLHGQRPRPTLARTDADADTIRVVGERVATEVERMMVGVVSFGTGRAAAIPGVRVAGKTGTAELRASRPCPPPPPAETDGTEPPPPPPPAGPCGEADTTDTDAWFVACAPAGGRDPRVCAAVLLIQAGAGGDTAAPVARQVLLAGLGR
jgi:cell division protein FtsI/penicillin-binding protein 2